MPHRIPVFPLDVVLFPGTPLPLHIFEPRYRTMLADCLEGDERFGIVPILPNGDAPGTGVTGCIAHIRATQLLDDGRSNIVVVGESRFVLERYLEESLPYATAMVSEFDDDPGTVSPELLRELRRLSREYLDTLHRLNDTALPESDFPDNAQVLSFQISAALELGTEFKQTLLTMRGTVERIRLLLRLLPPMVTDLSSRAADHEHARTNGKSHRTVKTDDFP